MFLSLYGLLIVQFYQKAYALTNVSPKTQHQSWSSTPGLLNPNPNRVESSRTKTRQPIFRQSQIKIFRLSHDDTRETKVAESNLFSTFWLGPERPMGPVDNGDGNGIGIGIGIGIGDGASVWIPIRIRIQLVSEDASWR